MNGPALLRRALLVLATTLIVARPLVVGEDPGLTANLADPWGMVLTLFWLLAAVGWAAWRFWLRPASEASSRPGAKSANEDNDSSSLALLAPGREDALSPHNWYGGIVQTALLATVALVFVSAEVASYKFPARLIAWEWFGLFVAFFVVRQLAVTPSEQRGFFAVVLAGAVSLAAQGIYQEFVEIPRNRRLAEDPEAFRKTWAEENPAQDNTNEGLLEQVRLRALENNIYGPYAHPNSYAGFLALCLPGLIGAVFLCRRMQAPGWQTILTAVCAVAVLAALWLTHSRGALLGLALASVGVALFVYRRTLRGHVLPVLLALTLLIGVMLAAWGSGLLTRGMGKSNNAIAQRLEYWRTTWQMIAERPWLGVGPGNFGENYQRLMADNSEEKIKDPHNFALEMWATCGVFAVLALLLTLGGFFARVANEMGRAGSVRDRSWLSLVADAPGSPEALPEGRWDFYLGGMFGLLLGFVLRVNTMSPNSILNETMAAALRSVVWFAAFGLLERIAWSNRSRLVLLTTGILALLLNLCVSGGIQFPSLAGPLWIAIALALNAASLQPTAWLSRPGVSMILPLPIFLGVFLGYVIYILYPILASDNLVREAVQAAAYFQEQKDKPAQQAALVRKDPAGFVQRGILDRLEQARRLTPEDARIYVQLAWWSGVRWDIQWQRRRSSDLPVAERAIAYGMRAVELDPQGGSGYFIQYRLRVWFVDLLDQIALAAEKVHGDPLFIAAKKVQAAEQKELAIKVLEQYLPHDPHDAGLRYLLASACFKAGDKAKGLAYAAKASQLDDGVTVPARKLTDRQRKQIDTWLGASPAR